MNTPNNNFQQQGESHRTEFFSYSSTSPFRVATNAGRVVTLANLGLTIDERSMVWQLAGALHDVTSSGVLLVELTQQGEGLTLGNQVLASDRADGRFVFDSRVQHSDSGFAYLQVRVADQQADVDNLPLLLAHCARHFRFILLHAEASTPSRVLFAAVAHSDISYPFLRKSAPSACSYQLFIKQLRSNPLHERVAVRPVVCLDYRESARGCHALFDPEMAIAAPGLNRELLGPCHFLHLSPGSLKLQLRSLAREIGRCRIGLALSSGGAKGLTHVGVIQVLEEAGVEVDMVAGSSMGAYVGSIWCHGNDGIEMEKLAREVEKRWGLIELMDPVLIPWRGFVKGYAVRRRLMRTLGEVDFGDLRRPLRVVAANLETLERVVFMDGLVAQAVHASLAIPGVCVPVRIGAEQFIDGGVVDPLPVDVLKEMGIEKIIAVNTIPSPEFMRCSARLQREQAEALKEKRRGMMKRVYEAVDLFTHGSAFKNLLLGLSAAQMRLAEDSVRGADVVIHPILSQAKWHDFTHPTKFIHLGRKVAQEHLSELKSLVKSKPHEIVYAQRSVAHAG